MPDGISSKVETAETCGRQGIRAGKTTKNVSVMCFHDELCQVYNGLMTALSLLREGSNKVFGKRRNFL